MLLLLASIVYGSPTSDARASLAQLRRAITSRDGQLLTQLLGPNRFRSPGATAVRWNDLDEYVTQAEPVVASPLRTVTGETTAGEPQVAIIGWDGDMLYAVRFFKDDQNRWLLAKIHLGAKARTTADRQAFETYIRKVPETRLALTGSSGGTARRLAISWMNSKRFEPRHPHHAVKPRHPLTRSTRWSTATIACGLRTSARRSPRCTTHVPP